MTEIKDSIRSMIQSLIKDDANKAELDFNPVVVAKMKDVTGISAEPSIESSTIEDSEEQEE